MFVDPCQSPCLDPWGSLVDGMRWDGMGWDGMGGNDWHNLPREFSDPHVAAQGIPVVSRAI